MREDYRTIVGQVRHEPDKTRGSRFIATAAPARTAQEAEACVARIRAEYPDATHHCFAYRVGAGGERLRFSDDGEPGGSAGKPILAQIVGRDLTDLVVVVTRYFGGTKLGVGGLVRAYGGAASAALARAQVRTVAVTRRVQVTYPYDRSGEVQGLLAASGVATVSADYGESVRLILDVPLRQLEELKRQLTDRTAGRCAIEEWNPES